MKKTKSLLDFTPKYHKGCGIQILSGEYHRLSKYNWLAAAWPGIALRIHSVPLFDLLCLMPVTDFAQFK